MRRSRQILHVYLTNANQRKLQSELRSDPPAASACKRSGGDWTHVCAQVDNKTDLEYQAGQKDKEEGAGEDRQQEPADGAKPDEKQPPEGAAGEEEQQQDVPEQVLQLAILKMQGAVPRSAWLCALQLRCMATG